MRLSRLLTSVALSLAAGSALAWSARSPEGVRGPAYSLEDRTVVGSQALAAELPELPRFMTTEGPMEGMALPPRRVRPEIWAACRVSAPPAMAVERPAAEPVAVARGGEGERPVRGHLVQLDGTRTTREGRPVGLQDLAGGPHATRPAGAPTIIPPGPSSGSAPPSAAVQRPVPPPARPAAQALVQTPTQPPPQPAARPLVREVRSPGVAPAGGSSAAGVRGPRVGAPASMVVAKVPDPPDADADSDDDVVVMPVSSLNGSLVRMSSTGSGVKVFTRPGMKPVARRSTPSPVSSRAKPAAPVKAVNTSVKRVS